MNRKIMELLACPLDGNFPLDMHVFEDDGEIVTGIIVCPECLRWYPVKEKIPQMLPDELRNKMEDTEFLDKWKNLFPRGILENRKIRENR